MEAKYGFVWFFVKKATLSRSESPPHDAMAPPQTAADPATRPSSHIVTSWTPRSSSATRRGGSPALQFAARVLYNRPVMADKGNRSNNGNTSLPPAHTPRQSRSGRT